MKPLEERLKWGELLWSGCKAVDAGFLQCSKGVNPLTGLTGPPPLPEEIVFAVNHNSFQGPSRALLPGISRASGSFFDWRDHPSRLSLLPHLVKSYAKHRATGWSLSAMVHRPCSWKGNGRRSERHSDRRKGIGNFDSHASEGELDKGYLLLPCCNSFSDFSSMGRIIMAF